MHMASYDWRLSLAELEARDHYFTRLKASIEVLVATNDGEKVVAVAHSMGSNVFYYFMQWVSAAKRHSGDQAAADAWVSEHVAAVVLVGNSLLGSPKALNGLLTGNIKEVLSLWQPMRAIVDQFVSRLDFAAIFRCIVGPDGVCVGGGSQMSWPSCASNPPSRFPM